ncbi:hypothetical protein [Pseudomonas japonica]|uniref:hypothetical protein n=1 Tax=Pseudomonas japonica TaxID=256466 RepID=UPI0005A951A2|nr:hypothetical protein [Pseudomonas japonica]
MKTVDIFASVMDQAFQDTQTRRYGAILLTRGVGGVAKLNPTAVWVDAVVAVIEAGSSYLRYCAAREVTAQIRAFNEQLEVTLAQQLRLGEDELKIIRRDRAERAKMITQVLAGAQNMKVLTAKTVERQLNSLRRQHVLLQAERRELGNFQELVALQVCLDRCIDATLALLLSPTGENA